MPVFCLGNLIGKVEMAPKGKIPERWLEYSKLGDPISGSKFVCFKCPLKEEILARTPKEDWFTPDDLMTSVADKGLKLGHVVNLTFTDKYYFAEALKENYNVKYSKLFVSGQQSEDDIDSEVGEKFVEIIDQAMENLNEGNFIGVHCTHGVNRTGFLVCFYLMKKLGWPFVKALAEFEKARGHKIENEDFLTQLRLLDKTWTKAKVTNQSASNLVKFEEVDFSTEPEKVSKAEEDTEEKEDDSPAKEAVDLFDPCSVETGKGERLSTDEEFLSLKLI